MVSVDSSKRPASASVTAFDAPADMPPTATFQPQLLPAVTEGVDGLEKLSLTIPAELLIVFSAGFRLQLLLP